MNVAPHAGAWIETRLCCYNLNKCGVAPHAGAWIETQPNGIMIWALTVAPHAGAWIETIFAVTPIARTGSHPMRVRGLKRK